MKEHILIIGGGILGATAAYYLSLSGHKVTVLEKGEAASGASGANLGQLSLIDREEPWHMALAQETFAIFAALGKTIDLEYDPCGGSVVLHDAEQHTAAQQCATHLATLGVKTEFLYGADILRAEPKLDNTRVHSLLYCPGEGKINPLNCTLAYWDMARRQGADLHCNTAVTGFSVKNGRISAVHSNKGDFNADIVINAGGAWARDIGRMLGLELPIDFHRATAYVSQPAPKLVSGPVVSGSMFLKRTSMHAKRHIGMGCIQTAHGSLIIAQATEDAPVESRAVTLPGLCLVAKLFLEYFPTLRDLEIVRAWACVTPFTPDGLPVFGFSREISNFFTLAGFKGAFSTAPAVAQRLVSAIDDGFVWENHIFSPDRVRTSAGQDTRGGEAI